MTLRRLITTAALLASFALVACDQGYDPVLDGPEATVDTSPESAQDAPEQDCGERPCNIHPAAWVELQNPPQPSHMLPAYNEHRRNGRRTPPVTTSPRIQSMGVDALPTERPDVSVDDLSHRPNGILPAYNEYRQQPRRTPRIEPADDGFDGFPSERDGMKGGAEECEACI